jgi:hypothetical protein
MCGCFNSHEKIGTYDILKINDLEIIKQAKLAEGAYGDVWKCKLKQG